MKLAGASLNQTPIDWESNVGNIIAVIAASKKEDVQLLCLPELCIPSYGCQDLFLSKWVIDKSVEGLLEIVAHTKDIAIAVGFPYEYEGLLYNCSAFVENEQIRGVYAKQILAKDGVHYEPRWFNPWPCGTQVTIQIGDFTVPFGDIEINWKDKRVAFEICEDAWHNDVRPGNHHKGVDIILNPSASHFAFEKAAFREHLIVESSARFNCTYIYANLLGNESGRMIFDGDVLIANKGKLIAKSKRLGYHNYELIVMNGDALEFTPFSRNEEFVKAQSLALFDYLRKSKSQGFVLSLSGGADSSTVAVIVSEMVKRTIADLGLGGFKKKLGHITSLHDCTTREEMVQKLLTCVYQSTENSSEETATSAEVLATSIGAEFHHWSVQNGVESVSRVIEETIGRSLTWEQDDIALQNIQARIRAPYIWMMANIKNCLLLATSNRSEAAVGYATMDGDTSGSISPIAGIDKAFIIQWLKWAETHLGYSALSHVNNLQPSAELRPLESAQTDEADLMPYDVLNRIENMFVYQRRSPEDITQILSKELGNKAEMYVNKFLSLWQRNQWKRERYAASFHIDEYSLDPKSWARFPILSGKY